MFYIIFHPEPILKNIARVLYAGSFNITVYSFPFWYINALFVGSMAVGMAHSWKSKYKYLALVAIWIVLHVGILKLLPIPLPWGIDNALGAIIFLAAEQCISGKVIAHYMVDCLSGKEPCQPWKR